MRKITIQEAVIASAIIIGISIFSIQFMKQASIERQVNAKIEQENKIIQEKKYEEVRRKLKLQECMRIAEENYWTFVKLNGTVNDQGTVTAKRNVWDKADKDKQIAIDNCYKINK